MMPYFLGKLQIAFFLESVALASKVRLSTAISAHSHGHLDVDPVMLPVPADSPPEIPQLILQNPASGWTFVLARSRFDLIVAQEPPRTPRPQGELIDESIAVAIEIWDELQRHFSASANRLGLVLTLVGQTEQAVEIVANRFIQNGYAEGAHELHVDMRHQVVEGMVSMNRWVRIRGVPAMESAPIRLVHEIDINSVPEIPLNVNVETARRFLGAARLVADRAITAFFPEIP